MEEHKNQIFESTAFEVTEYQNIGSYAIQSPKIPIEHVKNMLSNQPQVLLCQVNEQMLIVLTENAFEAQTMDYTYNGEKCQVSIKNYPMTTKAKLSLLFNHALEYSETVIRVSNELYFMASETFITTIKKGEKAKFYPFFSFEIVELEDKALFVLNIMLYSQQYPNLMKALDDDYLQKGASLDQLIVPLFKYKVNFMLFDSEYENNPNQDMRSLELQDNKENTERLVRLKHLDTDEYLIMPAINFNVLDKMDEKVLLYEKVYLLYKLKTIVTDLNIIRRTGVELSLKTHKPDIVVPKMSILNQLDLQVKDDDTQLANWLFICHENEADIGAKLVKDLFNTIKQLFRLQDFKPAKVYTLSSTEDKDLETTILEGLKAVNSNDFFFVVILINKEKPFTMDIESYLLLNNKKYLIFENSELKSQRNYMQTKIDELYLNFGSSFSGTTFSIDSLVSIIFIKFKDSIKGTYIQTCTLSIDQQNVDIVKRLHKSADFKSFEEFLECCTPKNAEKLFLVVDNRNHHLVDLNLHDNKNVVYLMNCCISIIPRFSFSNYYVDMKFDLQSSRNLVSYNRENTAKALEESIERIFIYGRMDRNNLLLMNRYKSYCLRFLNGLSELDLPVIENIFTIITSLKQDFGHYFS